MGAQVAQPDGGRGPHSRCIGGSRACVGKDEEEDPRREGLIVKGAPLTLTEARVILRADEALDLTYEARLAAGTLLSNEEGEAWIALVASANDRIATWEGRPTSVPKTTAPEVAPYPGGNEPDFQTLFMLAVANQQPEPRTGYTAKRLTTTDAAELAELLRVSVAPMLADHAHWQVWGPVLREIREKMIERLGDVAWAGPTSPTRS